MRLVPARSYGEHHRGWRPRPPLPFTAALLFSAATVGLLLNLATVALSAPLRACTVRAGTTLAGDAFIGLVTIVVYLLPGMPTIFLVQRRRGALLAGVLASVTLAGQVAVLVLMPFSRSC